MPGYGSPGPRWPLTDKEESHDSTIIECHTAAIHGGTLDPRE